VIWCFVLPAAGALVWDGPWLIVAMGLQWLLGIGVPKWSTVFFIGELLILGLLEWASRQWLPAPSVQRSSKRLLKESWILLAFSLLLSPVPGFIVWQGVVGFDAASRIYGLSRDVSRILRVRAVKVLFIIALALLILWTGPWT